MAGRRHKDFRSGDLKEELGILLLKRLAAVANVPRPEDLGIDAIATLLRVEDDLLFAESSFYVQVKSSSYKSVKFAGHEVRWLEKLKLPFFIGSVNMEEGSISLFAGHFLSRALIEHQWEEVELFLSPRPNTKPETPNNTYRKVHAGCPLLQWSMADMSDTGKMRNAYECLKVYLEVEQRNIDYRGIRYLEMIEWDTGVAALRNYGSCLMQKSDGSDLLPVLRSITPNLLAILSRTHSDNDRETYRIVRQLLAYMRTKGHDADPSDVAGKIDRQWDAFQPPEK